jgi:4-amino-4-deoxy-L-arabinose transferase-like glycosyltransferase
MKKFNTNAFFVLFTSIFFIILYKVFTVPITHDETATTVHYFYFNVWEIMMYPDKWSNNQILNTLITKLFILIFGAEQWVVRLPNVLFFIVYAAAVYRIVKFLFKEDSILFLPAAILFVSNPYLLDFFGLCRGYGIACALATLSVSYLISGFFRSKDKHIWISFALSFLASYANFTLLVYWVATVILVLFYFFMTRKQFRQYVRPFAVVVVVCLLYLALIANPIYKMSVNDEFRYWRSNGFYKETILSLIDAWRYESTLFFKISSHTIAIVILGILTVNLIIAFFQFKKSGYKMQSLNQPLFVSTFLILLSAFISIIQCSLLKTPNLYGRTALFFFPLFIIASIGLLSWLSLNVNKAVQIVAGFSIVLLSVLHLSFGINLKSIREWPYDASTLEVLQYLEYKHADKPIILKTSWFFHPSFHFYYATGKTPWLELKPYDKLIELNTNAEYYYIFSNEYDTLATKFEIDRKFSDDRWLLKRKPENSSE